LVGPGIGKSTFAAGLYAEMKQQNINVELVTEFAKDCVYEKQFELLKNDQLFLLAQQNRRLQRIEQSNENVQFVITDSPLLLGKIFANKNNYARNFTSFQNLVVDLFESYDNINLVLDRSLISYQSEGRVESYSESLEIDKLILNELNFWKMNYTTITDRNFKEVIKNSIL
jgi:deoxyadenosine/deoxycytidine kinase